MDSIERLESTMNSGRAWIVTAVVATVVVIGGALAFPRQVYDRFIWQYFWGPVYADAHNARCAVLTENGPKTLTDGCFQAEATGQIVARPGYTVVSEIGYAILLLFMLVGVYFLVRRLRLGQNRRLFFALVPFMFLGGALRVVEDATDAVVVRTDAGAVIGYPLNTLIISPVIYGVVFLLTLGAILIGLGLAKRNIVQFERYPTVVAAIGTAAVALTVGYIGYLVATIDTSGTRIGFYPQLPAVVLVLSGLIAWGLYAGLDRFAPWMNEGTGLMGVVVLFAHALDGIANVIAADWMGALGMGFLSYAPKHPANRIIIGVTEAIVPQSVLEVIGSAWPFLLVKLVAAVLVVSLFDDRIFEDSPQYAMLLLVAIVAVGLGPGTRDMLRATFGI
ncbi:DUF63 family protein [Halocatena pleomorpha]|uniref:DUF63 family protein n=1 Tax=Halocatena pleomorpha TaxID=1785090 RepID=A0A3P3R6X4_9EURY|nr:DUF63 family protein [Halocatena pleomorpha]RRJ29222.1 DUF63 family protein [Halocatena pleomorpha]